jgi:hypothetical protein
MNVFRSRSPVSVEQKLRNVPVTYFLFVCQFPLSDSAKTEKNYIKR